MAVGDIIRKVRLEKGMTLEDLGNMVGVGKSTVRKWENGMIAEMGIGKMNAVANALDIDPMVLFNEYHNGEHVNHQVATLTSAGEAPGLPQEYINGIEIGFMVKFLSGISKLNPSGLNALSTLMDVITSNPKYLK